MEHVAGMRTTGRRVTGPAADLVEVVGEDGAKHTALVHHARFWAHPALKELDPSMPFLRDPGVPGLLPVVRHVPAEGAFVYPAGTGWSVAEVVRVLADAGEQAGIRAGLELCYLGAQILVDANEAAEQTALTAHRSLEPRRIMIRPDGRVMVLGYGLPQVDLLEHLDTHRRPKDEDTLRYAPPERFEELEEDISSDLFCLALIGLELTLGRPIYDGLADDIREQASRGDASRRLYHWRERMPEAVHEAYARALKPDRDSRYRSGVDFVYAFHDLLGSLDAEGPSLADVMTRFRDTIQQGRAFQGGATAALTREELAELAADLEEGEVRVLPPPKRPRPSEEVEAEPEPEEPEEQRWGRVSRPSAQSASEDHARDRLRDRLRSESSRATRDIPEETSEDAARERLKARLRHRQSGAGATGRPRRIERTPAEDAVEEVVAAATPAPAAPPTGMAPAAASAGAGPAASAGAVPAASAGAVPVASAGAVPAASAGSAAAALLERLRGASPRAEVPTPQTNAGLPSSPSAETTPHVAAGPTSAPSAPVPPPTWQVTIDGIARETTIPPEGVVAEAIAGIVASLDLAAVDLLGHLDGWFLAHQAGMPIPGHRPVAEVDPTRPIELVRVPNAVVALSIEVRAQDTLRFRAPVSTAVPARFLVAHLVRWLALQPGAWSLAIGGTTLLPDQILAELRPGADTTLVVCR